MYNLSKTLCFLQSESSDDESSTDDVDRIFAEILAFDGHMLQPLSPAYSPLPVSPAPHRSPVVEQHPETAPESPSLVGTGITDDLSNPGIASVQAVDLRDDLELESTDSSASDAEESVDGDLEEEGQAESFKDHSEGQGQIVPDTGQNKEDETSKVSCQGQIDRGQGQTDRGQGQTDRGQGQTDRGQGQTDRGQDQTDRSQEQADKGHCQVEKNPLKIFEDIARISDDAENDNDIAKGKGHASERQDPSTEGDSQTNANNDLSVSQDNVSKNDPESLRTGFSAIKKHEKSPVKATAKLSPSKLRKQVSIDGDIVHVRRSSGSDRGIATTQHRPLPHQTSMGFDIHCDEEESVMSSDSPVVTPVTETLTQAANVTFTIGGQAIEPESTHQDSSLLDQEVAEAFEKLNPATVTSDESCPSTPSTAVCHSPSSVAVVTGVVFTSRPSSCTSTVTSSLPASRPSSPPLSLLHSSAASTAIAIPAFHAADIKRGTSGCRGDSPPPSPSYLPFIDDLPGPVSPLSGYEPTDSETAERKHELESRDEDNSTQTGDLHKHEPQVTHQQSSESTNPEKPDTQKIDTDKGATVQSEARPGDLGIAEQHSTEPQPLPGTELATTQPAGTSSGTMVTSTEAVKAISTRQGQKRYLPPPGSAPAHKKVNFS